MGRSAGNLADGLLSLLWGDQAFEDGGFSVFHVEVTVEGDGSGAWVGVGQNFFDVGEFSVQWN